MLQYNQWIINFGVIDVVILEEEVAPLYQSLQCSTCTE